MNLAFVFLLIGAFAASTDPVRSQSQFGFISLDCGLQPRNLSYIQKKRNISYISDVDFISHGVSSEIPEEFRQESQAPTRFLRSFPDGERNCYTLNVTQNDKFLIRATFLYGNYDGLNRFPRFDLYIGPNKWATVEIRDVRNETVVELIHVQRSKNLEVCVVKTGETTPFVSSLEVRPLNNQAYEIQSGSLNALGRMHFLPNQGFIRFDDDIHDRIWESYFDPEWARINTTAAVNSGNTFDPPQIAMRTAAVPKNATKPMSISLNLDPSSQLYVYMHFAELEVLGVNETREIVVKLNGRLWYKPFTPSYLGVFTVYNPGSESAPDGKFVFTFETSENSTRPPLLNCMEIYSVVDLSQQETDKNDVEAITNVEKMYELNKISWQGDPCAPQDYMWEGLNCSVTDGFPPRISSLNLSSSRLEGEIAPYIQDLTQLEELDLSNNNLTGEVPEFLVRMKSLSTINLSGNRLNGSVPPILLRRMNEGSLSLNVEGNQLLCGAEFCDRGKTGERKRNNFVVPVAASVASLAVLMALLSLFFCIRRKGLICSKESKEPSDPFATNEQSFSYSEIQRMTKNFKKVLGKGGFGIVYLGRLNGAEVAVKVLSHATAEGYRQFKAEVDVLLRVHHKNLLSLVGYCNDNRKLALIYEFMAKGDLKDHLSEKDGRSILSWEDRLRIAAESAQALEYLHHGCKPPMVHRDVKTANILLNEHLQAKIADFGLTRSFTVEGQTHLSTDVAGTPGYLDPEYFGTSQLTKKSDVYSFGIVLLEIVTNQSVIDNSREKVYIVEWVRLMVQRGDVGDIVDSRLRVDTDKNIVWKVVELALACAHLSPSRRPTMTNVVMELNKCLGAKKTRTSGNREESRLLR